MYLENEGYCCICSAKSKFSSENDWLRDNYRCHTCGTIPRVRALVHVLNMIEPIWKRLEVHESSPGSHFFAERCKSYSYSFYYEDTSLGSTKFGNPCENLEKLTFPDGSFDLFITQDVLEHVFRPDAALAEISRVLRPGGAHVFTVPKHRGLLESRRRASLENDRVVHHLDQEYHGNPISENGSLVTWDYGADFEGLVQQWSGYSTSNYTIRDRTLGIDGEFLDVFVTRKAHQNRLGQTSGLTGVE